MKPYKKYIVQMWDILHKMNMDNLIDKPNKYAAIKDIEIGLHELENAFEQEIDSTSSRTNY